MGARKGGGVLDGIGFAAADPQISVRRPSRVIETLQVGAEPLDSKAMAWQAATPMVEHLSTACTLLASSDPSGGICEGVEHATNAKTTIPKREIEDL